MRVLLVIVWIFTAPFIIGPPLFLLLMAMWWLIELPFKLYWGF